MQELLQFWLPPNVNFGKLLEQDFFVGGIPNQYHNTKEN